MTTLMALIMIAAVGASPDSVDLEKAFQGGGMAGFLSAVHGLEQKQGPEWTAEALTELAWDHEWGVEAAAVHALGKMGKAGKAVLPKLSQAMSQHTDFPSALLNDLGPGDIPLWLAEALLRADGESLGDAGFALATRFDLKSEKRLLPLLIQASGHADPDERSWSQYSAIRALGKMGDTAASAWPLLVEILSKEPTGDLEPSGKVKWNDIRGAAACTLGQIGANPENTARLLTSMLKHSDKRVRDWSALGLALLERKKRTEYAAKTLAGLLTSRECEVEAEAAQTLGRMGKAGKSVLPELAKAMNEGSDFPHSLLFVLGPGDIPLWFAEVLIHPDDPSFADVAPTLALFLANKNEKRLLPLLIQGARHANPDVRRWAITALGQMEDGAASARPLLIDILKKGSSAKSVGEKWAYGGFVLARWIF